MRGFCYTPHLPGLGLGRGPRASEWGERAHSRQKVNWQKQAATGKTDATASDTQAQAEEAAKRYSRQAGYTCETFLCGKHLSATGRHISCWHVRGKNVADSSVRCPRSLI